MSDWGATPSWEFALAGLDQESGAQIDVLIGRPRRSPTPLREAPTPRASCPQERLSEMVRRILRSMYAVGIDALGRRPPEVDMAAHDAIALETARQGIVLLEERRRPAARADDDRAHRGDRRPRAARRAGRHRLERRRPARRLRGRRSPSAAPGIMGGARNLYLLPSSPLAELRRAACRMREIEFDPGMTPAEAALLARRCDVADRVRDPRRGRGLRHPRPVAAVGPGRGDRGRGGREPEHHRRARDRQPGRHAVARQGARDRRRRGTRARPAARRSPRCSPARSTRPAGCRSPSPPTSPRRRGRSCPASARRGARRRRSATTRAPRSATAGSRSTGAAAALRLRPRAELHDVRVRRPRGWPAARRSRRRSP